MLLGRNTPVTLLLLAAIVVVFVAQLLTGGAEAGSLTELGANYGPAIVHGQWWRPVTSLFLHGGIVHLLVNVWALVQLGALFERWLGSFRLLLVYFASGVAGSLASALTTQSLSVGASGAIFGLLGALISFLLRRRQGLTPEAKSVLMQLVGWAVFNVAFGFSTPGIDNAAHLGGWAAGFLVGFGLRGVRGD